MIKRKSSILIIILVVGFGLTLRANAKDSYAPVVVIELFTSEGCSSCPPADQILWELTETSREENPQIFTLGFHVDYWDYIGWKDRFATPEYTQRQRSYAKTNGSRQVYTPQMIVNGTEAFGGYRKDLALKNIKKFLTIPAENKIDLTVQRQNNNVDVFYTVTGAQSGDLLYIALVQNTAESRVTRGENTGRSLQHANVVRDFNTVPLNPSSQKPLMGKSTLKLPGNMEWENISVIAYTQDPKNLKIKGAARFE